MKRYMILIAVSLLLTSLLCGCSSEAYEEKAEDYIVEETIAAYSYSRYSAPREADTVATSNTTVSANRKLIKTVSMSVETEDFDNTLADLEQRTNDFGGYIESVNVNSRYASSQRTANYTIRIPAEQIDAFIDHIGNNSNVLSRIEKQDDITLQYVDTESECAALRIEQERLMELLETAESLTDILEIESRLTEIRYRLESVESQLRAYDNQVSYATVNLSIDEVEVYTPTEEKGFWEKIGDGFISSIKGAWSFIKSVFYLLVVALPYLVVLGVVAAVILVLVFHFIRKRKKKDQNNS